MDPLTIGAVAFVALLAALMVIGLYLANRRPRSREQAMSEDARIADRIIAESIEKEKDRE